MTILLVIFILVSIYAKVGLLSIMAWEIVSDIKGACCVPTWLDNWYEFITEKWFFFFN